MDHADRPRPNRLSFTRLALLGSLALWLTALALPSYNAYVESDGPANPIYGIEALQYGWLLPLSNVAVPGPFETEPVIGEPVDSRPIWLQMAGFAWYANLFWVWNIACGLIGTRPSRSAALLSALLAPWALQSFYTELPFIRDIGWGVTPQIGAYAWTFAILMWSVAAWRDKVQRL